MSAEDQTRAPGEADASQAELASVAAVEAPTETATPRGPTTPPTGSPTETSAAPATSDGSAAPATADPPALATINTMPRSVPVLGRDPSWRELPGPYARDVLCARLAEKAARGYPMSMRDYTDGTSVAALCEPKARAEGGGTARAAEVGAWSSGQWSEHINLLVETSQGWFALPHVEYRIKNRPVTIDAVAVRRVALGPDAREVDEIAIKMRRRYGALAIEWERRVLCRARADGHLLCTPPLLTAFELTHGRQRQRLELDVVYAGDGSIELTRRGELPRRLSRTCDEQREFDGNAWCDGDIGGFVEGRFAL